MRTLSSEYSRRVSSSPPARRTIREPCSHCVSPGLIVWLEPTLLEADFAELERAGVWLAKFGFGDFASPLDGEPQVRWAQQHGLKVMCHSGGASIPGSQPITADHLLRLRPDVCGHANGGPTALPDAGLERLVRDYYQGRFDPEGLPPARVQALAAQSVTVIARLDAALGARSAPSAPREFAVRALVRRR